MQLSSYVTNADDTRKINLKMDPEAAKIALTADFPSISECTLVRNHPPK